ncbi:MAG: GNAT family N-acetyltransferase [Actinomycetota bacterium]|nr:GNAT family N-acetyltransferase [Actinomycetota bacterium]
MTVRQAGREDVLEICALIVGLAEFEGLAGEVEFDPEVVALHLFGPAPAARVLLATENATGEVAGFALYFTTFSTFLGRPGIWLEDLFVRPQHRGRGHGSNLLHALRGLTDGRVEWTVLDWNVEAIEFYEALGARAVPGWTRYRWLPGSSS